MTLLRSLAVTCLSLLLSAVAAAASLAPYQPVRDRADRIEALRSPGATLSGRVRGVATGEPVLVEARGPGWTVGAWTEPDGGYRLDGLTPGEWRVTASLAVDPVHPTHQVSVPVEIVEGEDAVILDLAFELGNLTLEGRLVGAPAEPYSLRLLPARSSAPISLALASEETGGFRFRRLRPGAYRLRIEDPDGQEVAEEEVELGSDRTLEIGIGAGG